MGVEEEDPEEGGVGLEEGKRKACIITPVITCIICKVLGLSLHQQEAALMSPQVLHLFRVVWMIVKHQVWPVLMNSFILKHIQTNFVLFVTLLKRVSWVRETWPSIQ